MNSSSNSNIANSGNFLRTSRTFPTEPQALSVELSKSYIDIANEVNARISGIFGVGAMIITSEQWFLRGESGRQFTLRQVYIFSAVGSIPHGINTKNITGFTRIFGSFTDGTNFYPLPYVSTVASNQVQVVITPTNIVITAGGGAPAVVSGQIVLEWISEI